MKCNNCGNEIPNGANVCPYCGTPVVNPNVVGQAPQQTVYVNPAPNSDMDYTPISMWGYFGYEILFAIPCVGLILLLVFSFGGTKNINVRNFARSYFCFLIVVVVLALILSAILGISLANL